MMRGNLSGLLGGMVVLWVACGAWAQQGATQPTTAPAEAEPLQATVKEVSGVAQYLRAGKDQKWQPLKPGQKLDELTVIRTGFSTRVVLVFADEAEATIQRATKMGVGQLRKVGEVTRTKVGLKYGSVRVNVAKARGPSDFTVATPVATLERAGAIGLERGLRYVYLGNVPCHPAENTRCPACGELLVERQHHALARCRIVQGKCPNCQAEIPGRWA